LSATQSEIFQPADYSLQNINQYDFSVSPLDPRQREL